MPKTPFPAAGEAMPVATITRRTVMTGTAATALTVAAPAAQALSGHPDAELFRLDREMQAVHDEAKRLEKEQRRISNAVVAAVGPGPVHPRDWKQPEMTPEARETFRGTTLADFRAGRLPDAYLAWEQECERQKAPVQKAWDDWGKRQDKQYRLLGYDALEKEWNARWGELNEIGDRISQTPAHTVEGMAVKVRAMRRQCVFEDTDEPGLIALAEDIERIAGGLS